MGFQSTIHRDQAPGVEGDFASLNPFSSVLAGAGALVAPAGGVDVGKFVWVGPNGQVSRSYIAGYQLGFVGRNQQALITEFLGEATMRVPEGFMLNVFSSGDFWARFPAGAQVGQNVYADPNDGTPLAGATAPSLASGTGSAGFTGTATLANGSTTLTVATATAGILSPGDLVTGTSIPANTSIVAQLTGTPGKVGTYQMSAAATADVGSAEAIVGHSNFMLVTAVSAGAFTFGDPISGTNVSGGTTVTGQATPFSGVATLNSDTSFVVTSVTPGTDLLRVGATVVGAGIPASTTISSQSSGTPGGVGTYVLSQAATATGAGVEVTTADSAGGTGLYTISLNQQFASTTVSVSGTAQATGWKVRGTYSPVADNTLAKISVY